jgi:DNA polymerase-4
VSLGCKFYYGQVEAIHRPELRGKAFVVGGDQESRKGIVLTKSPEAKRYGIKTGISIAEALGLFPNLIVVPANYPLYAYFTKRMRDIVRQHSDAIKPFGSDEMWASLYGKRDFALKTVAEIRYQLWKQLCLTVSIGVGDNLPYAKLGSDLAPVSGVCELWNDEREQSVYTLPVSNLLFVGPATAEKFNKCGIITIGDLARSTPERICKIIKNKTGEAIWSMAAGQDSTPVSSFDAEDESDIKSIGHSNTMPYDLMNEAQVKDAFYMLAEPVAERMRDHGFEARTVKISIRDNGLVGFERQMKLPRPTNLVAELVPAAMELFRRSYSFSRGIRAIGIRGADLIAEGGIVQLDLFSDEEKRQQIIRLERCMDRIRGRWGHHKLMRANLMKKTMKGVNANNNIGDEPIFYTFR